MVFDLDDVLAYRTRKIVVIRDRWLGIIFSCSLLGLALYFVIKEICIDHAYLQLHPIKGDVDYLVEANQSEWPSSAQLPYCTQYSGNQPSDQQRNCIFMPRKGIGQGSTHDTIFFASRVIQSDTVDAACLQMFPHKEVACSSRPFSSMNTAVFVANAEHYTLGLRHAVRYQKCDFWRCEDAIFRSDTLQDEAKLKCASGGDITVQRGARYGPALDKLKVYDLLKCAGIDSLDELDTVTDNGDPKTYRHNGVSLKLAITHQQNMWGNPIGYTYSLTYVPVAPRIVLHDAERAAAALANNKTMRTAALDSVLSHTEFETRMGIGIQASFDGHYGIPDFTTSVICLLAYVALLSAIRLFMRFCMLYLLPSRKHYRELILETSVDFSELRDGSGEALAAMERVSSMNSAQKGERGKVRARMQESEPTSLEDRVTSLEAQLSDLRKALVPQAPLCDSSEINYQPRHLEATEPALAGRASLIDDSVAAVVAEVRQILNAARIKRKFTCWNEDERVALPSIPAYEQAPTSTQCLTCLQLLASMDAQLNSRMDQLCRLDGENILGEVQLKTASSHAVDNLLVQEYAAPGSHVMAESRTTPNQVHPSRSANGVLRGWHMEQSSGATCGVANQGLLGILPSQVAEPSENEEPAAHVSQDANLR